MNRLILRILLTAATYALACFAAAMIYRIGMDLLFRGSKMLESGSMRGVIVWGFGTGTFRSGIYLAKIIAIVCLPLSLIAVLTAEARQIQSLRYFLVFGFALASLVYAWEFWLVIKFLAGFPPSDHDFSPRLVIGYFLAISGGLCGGLAYWALAGKTSGNWKPSGRTEP